MIAAFSYATKNIKATQLCKNGKLFFIEHHQKVSNLYYYSKQTLFYSLFYWQQLYHDRFKKAIPWLEDGPNLLVPRQAH